MALSITNPSLKAVTVQVLRDGFAGRDITPTTALQILPNNPEDWAELPCVTVQQLSDAESNPHIGDSLADQSLEDDTEVTAGQSTLFTQTVEIRLWSKKAQERDRLGLMLKEELFRGRGTSDAPGPFIATDGLDLPKISGGHDEEISDLSREYAPYPIFCRTYILSALTELTIQHGAGPALDDFQVREDSYEVDLAIDFPTASQP
jgi:hypothetical protein